MIHEFGDWSASRAFVNGLTDLADSVVAIEAAFYLQRHFTVIGLNERLLAATGGIPLSLPRRVRDDLAIFQDHNIKPVFVFSGLQPGSPFAPFAQANQTAAKAEKAWDIYSQGDAPTAVDEFGTSGYATPERYAAYFQSILLDAGIEFQVAPYSSLGQLAYLAKHGADYIDAIAGPSDLLLYDVDNVITGFNFDYEKKDYTFTFVKRQHCIEELGNLPPDTFVDACMLSGCSLLPTLPSLSSPTSRTRPPKVRSVIDLMRSNNQNGYTVCNSFQDDPAFKSARYLDRFERSRLSVKHPVVLTASGNVEPLERESLPNDLHKVIGQRLPAELYYYVSIAAISPTLLNKLALQHIHEPCPIDGGESETYRQLVSTGLNGIRVRALQLVAKALFRYYLHSTINMTCWFSPDRTTQLSLVEESEDTQASVDRWLVSQEVMNESAELKGSPPTLRKTLFALSDAAFAARTTESEQHRLENSEELKSNAIWRFFQLRGYTNADHTLSSWGKVLYAVLAALPENQSNEEAALLAVELLRHDLLRSDVMFPSYTGQPSVSQDSDKRISMLLCRVACLLSINQEDIGFHGPLSRHLLGFGSIVESLRSTLRELFEASLASLLLNGNVRRDQVDLTRVGLGLPLLPAIDIGLGLLIKYYFDKLMSHEDSTSADSKAAARNQGMTDLFTRCLDYDGELRRCFKLWDAVYAGFKVAVAEKVLRADSEVWEATDSWVQKHR